MGEVVRSAAAAAVAAPLLRSNPAAAKMDKSNKAPEIVIMDHRGCSRKAGGEYTGGKSGDMNDEMCVKSPCPRSRAAPSTRSRSSRSKRVRLYGIRVRTAYQTCEATRGARQFMLLTRPRSRHVEISTSCVASQSVNV